MATYFECLGANLNFVSKIPIVGIHIEVDRAPGQLKPTIAAIKSTPVIPSLGLVFSRKIWKTDISAAVEALGGGQVIFATSSSLLHTPPNPRFREEADKGTERLVLLRFGESQRNLYHRRSSLRFSGP
jgi:hypothetical protein